MFPVYVALKTQLSSEWNGSDMASENFPTTKAQSAMGD